MESIEKLRSWASYYLESDYEKEHDVHDLAKAIEREVSERYMELPLDADGVPIHIGDLVKVNDGEDEGYIDGFTSELMYGEGELMPTIDTVQYRARDMRHVSERTIEDVLGDVMKETRLADMTNAEIVAKYADEIRGLL